MQNCLKSTHKTITNLLHFWSPLWEFVGALQSQLQQLPGKVPRPIRTSFVTEFADNLLLKPLFILECIHSFKDYVNLLERFDISNKLKITYNFINHRYRLIEAPWHCSQCYHPRLTDLGQVKCSGSTRIFFFFCGGGVASRGKMQFRRGKNPPLVKCKHEL